MWCFTFFGLLFLVVGLCQTDKYPCQEDLATDITDGVLLENQSILKNDTVFDLSNYYRNKENRILGCICNIKPCIQKCCGPNEKFEDRKCVKSKEKLQLTFYEGVENVSVSNNSFFILYNKKFSNGSTLLTPNSRLFLQKNGSLHWTEKSLTLKRAYTDFCIETFNFPQLEMYNMVSALIRITDGDKKAVNRNESTKEYFKLIGELNITSSTSNI